MTENQPEAWLRGPVEGIDPLLMPAAHALIGAAEDMERAAAGLSAEELKSRRAKRFYAIGRSGLQ